jgi:hypothetical protein
VLKPRISFSVLLPLIALTLWTVLVPTQTAYVYFRLLQLTHGSPRVELDSGNISFSVPRDHLLSFSLEGIAQREHSFIEAVYIPGNVGDILISLPTTWPTTWCPAHLTFDEWRCLSWPIFCLPAWWFAGRGLDALLGWRRPRWWTLLIGTLLCAGFLFLLCGLRFGLSASDRSGITWVYWGLALWTFLFATFPSAWIRRAFTRKFTAAEIPAEVPIG